MCKLRMFKIGKNRQMWAGEGVKSNRASGGRMESTTLKKSDCEFACQTVRRHSNIILQSIYKQKPTDNQVDLICFYLYKQGNNIEIAVYRT